MKFKVGDKVRIVLNEKSAEGKKDYPKGVYTIDELRKGKYCFILKEERVYRFSEDELLHALPNNVLSRIMYPDLVPTECGKYLTKENK